MPKKPLSIAEEAELYARWDRGTFPTVEESIDYHHAKHGVGMTRSDYLRKAADFKKVRVEPCGLMT